MSVEFIDLYKKVMDHTLLTPDRLWYLWLLPRLLSEANIKGEHAELGTYRGGSARMIYDSCHGNFPLHVFDTFSGLPASQIRDKVDYHTRNNPYDNDMPKGVIGAGSFASDLSEVVAFLKNDKDNVHFYPGTFPDTFEPVKGGKFSFVHIDMDLYEPTAAALSLFWKILVPGGLMVLDDYGHLHGVTHAVNEFSLEENIPVNHTAFMQCVLRKPGVTDTTTWHPDNILWQFGG